MLISQPPRARLIVFGIAFGYPLAGIVYQFLHYLLGLRRLGYDVYYVEDSARWVYDPAIQELTDDPADNVARVAPVLEKYGFEGKWALHAAYPGGSCYGMSHEQL